ncbi:MAG: LysM peptidoglycan-binding domain-containing protein [Planctomycetota bacterium]
MGRTEKQIIIGAGAFIALFVVLVLFKGLKKTEVPRKPETKALSSPTDWVDPGTEPDPRLALVVPGVQESQGLAQEPPAVRQAGAGKIPPGPGAEAPAAVSDEPEPSGELLGRELDYDTHLMPYTVRKGDTLSGIALKELGSARRWQEIRALNETLDEHGLQPGGVIWLPGDPASAGPEPAGKAGPGTVQKEESPPAGSSTYTVQPGDSLWKISKRFFGGPRGIERIVAANRDKLAGRDAVLRVGTVLRIPE